MSVQNNKIAVYSRKSRYTGKGESIDNQIELCQEYIQAHFSADLASITVFEDEGFSGGNLNRPGFKAMMEQACQHQFSAIVVYRLDRISRNISDFTSLIEELSRLNIAFVSIREQFDTSTPMGRAMMYIASVFSQLERETIAERIRDNMHELAKTGRWLGGIAPTGYTSKSIQTVTVDGKSKKMCQLQLVPKESALVQLIFELYTANDSLTQTEAELLKRGIKTKNGRNFTRFSIKNILQNPVYLCADEAAFAYFQTKGAELFTPLQEFDGVHGILAYNRTDQEKGRTAILQPIQNWIITVGQHPGLIRSSIWIHVQNSLERNKNKSYHKPRTNKALLTGLIWCGCGSRMYPKLSSRMASDGKTIYSYVCKTKEHSKRSLCSAKNVSGNALDHEILLQIKNLPEDHDAFIRQLEKETHRYFDRKKNSSQKSQELHLQQKSINNKLSCLISSLEEFHDSAALPEIRRRMDALVQQKTDLQHQIDALEALSPQHELDSLQFNRLSQTLSSFQLCIDLMSCLQKRSLIQSLVHQILWQAPYCYLIFQGADTCFSIPQPGTVAIPQKGTNKPCKSLLCENSK